MHGNVQIGGPSHHYPGPAYTRRLDIVNYSLTCACHEVKRVRVFSPLFFPPQKRINHFCKETLPRGKFSHNSPQKGQARQAKLLTLGPLRLGTRRARGCAHVWPAPLVWSAQWRAPLISSGCPRLRRRRMTRCGRSGNSPLSAHGAKMAHRPWSWWVGAS